MKKISIAFLTYTCAAHFEKGSSTSDYSDTFSSVKVLEYMFREKLWTPGVDRVGKTHANFFRQFVWLAPIYSIVFIMFVNCIVNSK